MDSDNISLSLATHGVFTGQERLGNTSYWPKKQLLVMFGDQKLMRVYTFTDDQTKNHS